MASLKNSPKSGLVERYSIRTKVLFGHTDIGDICAFPLFLSKNQSCAVSCELLLSDQNKSLLLSEVKAQVLASVPAQAILKPDGYEIVLFVEEGHARCEEIAYAYPLFILPDDGPVKGSQNHVVVVTWTISSALRSALFSESDRKVKKL